MNPMNSTLDVLVIGAGQAGLALGYHLRQTGLRFLLVDRHEQVGDSWRKRFDSLVLFTPRAYSALPGLEVPGDPESYPTKDEIAGYLETYARHFGLPVELSAGIEQLEYVDGGYRATTTSGQVISSQAVVLATGAFQQPAVPAIADQFSADVAQLTPETYKNPETTPTGTVLVVGDGATGRQIARELGESRQVLLAAGRPRRVSPNRMLGRNIFWWMDKLGLLRASRESAIGRFLMRTDPFPGKDLELDRLRERGVTVVGRLTDVAGRKASFASGEPAEVDAVIWATGYRDDSEWVAIPEVKDTRGAFVQERGISPVPSLTFIGRSWQATRGSALLTDVGADADSVVRHLAQTLNSPRPAGNQAPTFQRDAGVPVAHAMSGDVGDATP